MSNPNSPHDPLSRPDGMTLFRKECAEFSSSADTPSNPDAPTLAYLPNEQQASRRDVAPGQLLLNRYELLEWIGAGGMGEVWKALDPQLERVVAIKRIKPELASQQSLLDRFFQEAKAVAALNHPHIVQIYDRGTDASGEFFVMEYVDGPCLSRLLDEHGAFDVERTVRIGKAMCDGLQAAHDKGILHRDVKPANILLAPGDVPKLTDFGLARLEFVGEPSLTSGVIGTPMYMSPEQRTAPNTMTAASDQWSLAAALYHLVTGEPPQFMRESRIPGALRSILSRSLEVAPQNRFSGIAEFAEALEQAIGPNSWMTESSTDLERLVKEMQARVTALHEDAKRLIEDDRNYSAAVTVLLQIPEHLRNEEMFHLATIRRDRVSALDREIEVRAKAFRFSELTPLIQEMLELQPQRDDLQRLRDSIPSESTFTTASPSQPSSESSGSMGLSPAPCSYPPGPLCVVSWMSNGRSLTTSDVRYFGFRHFAWLLRVIPHRAYKLVFDHDGQRLALDKCVWNLRNNVREES